MSDETLWSTLSADATSIALPGLGVLRRQHQPARIDPEKGLIYPPCDVWTLEPGPCVATAPHAAELSAQVTAQLDAEGFAEAPGLGTFRREAAGVVTFEPQAALAPEPLVPFMHAPKRPPAAQPPDAEALPEAAAVTPHYPPPSRQDLRKLLVIAGLLLAITSLVVVFKHDITHALGITNKPSVVRTEEYDFEGELEALFQEEGAPRVYADTSPSPADTLFRYFLIVGMGRDTTHTDSLTGHWTEAGFAPERIAGRIPGTFRISLFETAARDSMLSRLDSLKTAGLIPEDSWVLKTAEH